MTRARVGSCNHRRSDDLLAGPKGGLWPLRVGDGHHTQQGACSAQRWGLCPLPHHGTEAEWRGCHTGGAGVHARRLWSVWLFWFFTLCFLFSFFPLMCQYGRHSSVLKDYRIYAWCHWDFDAAWTQHVSIIIVERQQQTCNLSKEVIEPRVLQQFYYIIEPRVLQQFYYVTCKSFSGHSDFWGGGDGGVCFALVFHIMCQRSFLVCRSPLYLLKPVFGHTFCLDSGCLVAALGNWRFFFNVFCKIFILSQDGKRAFMLKTLMHIWHNTLCKVQCNPSTRAW